MSSFKKYPVKEWLWYMAALRRNPDFIRECDEEVQDFLKNSPVLRRALKSRPEQFGEDPHKNPHVLRAFIDSREGEALGKRWGLIEGWHYSCPDFPLPEKMCPIVPLSISQEQITLKVDLLASKKDLMAWFEYQVDRFKFKKTRGPDTDSTLPFNIYDLYQKTRNFWKVTCQLFPEVAGKNYNDDPEAKRRYEEVKRNYKKAQAWIDSIKPAE